MKKNCTIIGISGGSGSGKTTVARRIDEAVEHQQVKILTHDSYYLDRSNLPPEERERINYDHPDAFDKDLFHYHLNELSAGRAIDCPVYDYETHTRSERTIRFEPCRVLIVEGILVLQDEIARNMMDIRLYVETSSDIRLARRIRRDCQQRGRDIESVLRQYFDIVRPMHLQYVEPCKAHADLIVPEGGNNQVAIDIISTKVKQMLSLE
jgi:uridine kinase